MHYQNLMNEQVNKLYKIIPEFIYGENEESLEMVIGKLLKEKNKTVSLLKAAQEEKLHI